MLFVCAVALVTMPMSAVADALTQKNYMRLMAPGWNLGNTLEAIPSETSWGNPIPNEALMKGVKTAGFKSIRIPIAWSQYADKDNNIKPTWMKHVTDVVKTARKAGLVVVLNVHWDGGWLVPTAEKKEAGNKKLAKFWKQIASNFRNFDDKVLFAGTNEVMVPGDYSAPKDEYADAQNSFNQTFVEVVRATGGKNLNRWLVVQGFNTDIDHTLKRNVTLPKDSAKNKLMMEVHYYSPYNFTLNEKSDIWQWGKTATDPKATETWANESYVDAQFAKMKAAFVLKGVPVILGEFATHMKPKFPGMVGFRTLWDGYITQAAVKNGMVPMYWDNGTTEGLFYRQTGKVKDRAVINAIMSASKK